MPPLSATLPSTASGKPTKVRFNVVGIMLLMAGVTYLDRVAIGVAAPKIREDLGLNAEQMSYVFSAFAIAYAAFEIPTAWWADRLGTRATLARIVLWWSAFTMATAGAWNYVSMLVARFLFGAGEAGAWPCMARTFARWIPISERGKILGVFFAGAHLSGALTPMLVLWMMQFMSWRAVFVIFGFVGVAWAIWWYAWFRNEPSEHKSVNAAEVEKITAGREAVRESHHGWEYWKILFTSKNAMLLCLAYMPTSASFYFCITWLPTYLAEKHGLAKTELGIFAGLPLFLSVFADLFGGVTTDSMVKKFGLRMGRVGVGVAGSILAAGFMFLAATVNHPQIAATCLALAVASTMFTLGASWGSCTDMGGQNVGVVSAAMNTAGQIASIPAPPLTVFLVAKFGNWNAPIYVMSAFFVVGTIAWTLIDPRKQVFAAKES
jgi:ACS family glucarate transporter-like MFS transporter